MMIRLLLILALILGSSIDLNAQSPFAATQDLPVAYQGRFRSLDAASRTWLYDNYHAYHLKTADLPAFHAEDPSALTLLWKVHFLGNTPYDNAPLFWVHLADVKALLFPHESLKTERYSYNQLIKPLQSADTNPAPKKVIDELSRLKNLLAAYKDNPSPDLSNKQLQTAVEQLRKQDLSPKEIAARLAQQIPLASRLRQLGTSMKMLPSALSKGEWISLNALSLLDYNPTKDTLLPIGNFTQFSNTAFERLRTRYLTLEKITKTHSPIELEQAAQNFANAYIAAYQEIANTPYYQATGKALYYPTLQQLKSETLYLKLPLIEIATIAYLIAALSILLSMKTPSKSLSYASFAFLFIGFILHTTVLALRCYILGRPPVSNMFETVIYVPWIAIITGFTYYCFTKNRLVLLAGIVASLALLILLKVTGLNSKLENVQAVLDSQYWLIIHVLMVVGSYGAFAACGVIGHLYLLSFWRNNPDPTAQAETAKAILYTMYAGVALLIPGTILGGVWAAESWGRFWDWDPKESWAFISACVYVFFIHAYTFRYIRDIGLAVGSIVGLVAISFTWYGVNYVLGSGLHTYGFGSGGEIYYFSYLFFEALFIIFSLLCAKRKNLLELK